MSQPKLVITADDYGMSPLFNRGIEELAFLGLVTGISVMVKQPFVEPTQLDFPRVAIGLHLELKENSNYQEIKNQLLSFREKFGRLPAYLDGHRHCHLTKANLSIVIKVAREFYLPVRSRFPEDREKFTHQSIPTSQNFISWHPSRLSVLRGRLKEAEGYSFSELVVHPGYFDQNCDYPYNQERESEILFLKSDQFQTLISPFRLVSYLELI